MEFIIEFGAPVDGGTTFAVLDHIERIVPYLPRATLASVDASENVGSVLVELEPVQVTPTAVTHA